MDIVIVIHIESGFEWRMTGEECDIFFAGYIEEGTFNSDDWIIIEY